MLPLANHTLNTIGRALERIKCRNTTEEETNLNMPLIIGQACQMLIQQINQESDPHVFFVTWRSHMPLLLPELDRTIKFHTISLDPRLELDGPEQNWGWHIFPAVDSRTAHLSKADLGRKINKAMTSIRSGMPSGVLKDIALVATATDGCEVVSLLDDLRCEKLRPGEAWTVSLQLRVPDIANDLKITSKELSVSSIPVKKDTVNELIDEIQRMLNVSDAFCSRDILRVCLQYTRRLSEWQASCKAYGQCTIARVSRRTIHSRTSLE